MVFQVKNDYLKLEIPIEYELSVQLCCLEIRRFFKDITQFALDKKSNFEYLEKDIGLHKFLPSSVITSVKVCISFIQLVFYLCFSLNSSKHFNKFVDPKTKMY